MASVLRKNLPRAEIAMLIQHYTAEIVEDNPDVDDVLFYDRDGRLIPILRMVNLLRTKHFDVVFHTHPRFRLALITWLARIPARVGTGYRWYSFLFNKKLFEHRKDARFHELEYNLHLLGAIGCSPDAMDVTPVLHVRPEAAEKVLTLLDRSGIPAEDRIALIHPGSGKSARDWDPQNFGLLGRRLATLSHVRVVVTGSESERMLVEEVAAAAGPGAVSLVDRLSLHEYAALAKRSTVFVGNSTGPIHIAAAVGTPVIGLYPQVTPLSAARWGPYTQKKKIFTPQNQPADCRKCLAASHRRCECMETIRVDEVFAAAQELIEHPVQERAA